MTGQKETKAVVSGGAATRARRTAALDAGAGDDDDLGDMVQNLHELSSFFQDELDAGAGGVPHRQLEARVAAILAKSSTAADAGADVPPTPFVDVFNVGAAPAGADMGLRGLSPTFEEDSEDSEDSDSEDSDLFEFDSPSFARFMGPGAAAHSSH